MTTKQKEISDTAQEAILILVNALWFATKNKNLRMIKVISKDLQELANRQ